MGCYQNIDQLETQKPNNLFYEMILKTLIYKKVKTINEINNCQIKKEIDMSVYNNNN